MTISSDVELERLDAFLARPSRSRRDNLDYLEWMQRNFCVDEAFNSAITKRASDLRAEIVMSEW